MHYQPQDTELSKFYTSLGKAICEFQKFEYLVAVILCVVKNKEFRNIEEAWAALDRDFAKTLGKLTKQLNANVAFVETFRFHLAELVHERNWIVHRLPRAMHAFTSEQWEFEKLISRLGHTLEFCSSVRSMLDDWFFKHEEYKWKVHSLPAEIHANLATLKQL